MQIRLKIYPKSFSDAFVTIFLLLIIPLIYYFELWIVLPNFYQQWGPTYILHFLLGNFILFNLCANLIGIILIDTSIKGKLINFHNQKWKFCAICESMVPPRSWHCPVCKICILKRDHHCMFTSCCIGHFNHRFFLVFIFYMFLATFYSTLFNCQYLFSNFETITWITFIKIIFPLAMLFLEWSWKQFYIALIIIVTIGCLFTGTLLIYHLKLILKGRVTHERNEAISLYDRGKMENLKTVLGEKWYLVWISPFIKSELNCDGINWIISNNKIK